MTKPELVKRYNRAMHAVQSATAYEISAFGFNSASADPKSLRVGINSAMVETHALASLLMEKGVFTEEEYLTSLVNCAEAEKKRMTERVRERTGNPNITFS